MKHFAENRQKTDVLWCTSGKCLALIGKDQWANIIAYLYISIGERDQFVRKKLKVLKSVGKMALCELETPTGVEIKQINPRRIYV